MLLFELFDSGIGDSGEGDLIHDLRQSIMDILTPLASQGVPFVTVQSVMDQLNQLRSGIAIDRNLVMTVLDPEKVKMITKIEGDRIYFTVPTADPRKVDDNQAEKDKDHVNQQAQKQAEKNIKN